MLPYSEILYHSEWTYPHNVYLSDSTLVLAGLYWNLLPYPASLEAVGELTPQTGCSQHRGAAALGTNHNSLNPTALTTDKMTLQNSNTTLHKLISISSRTSMWQACNKITDKITEHAAILHPKDQTNLLRQIHYTGLARTTFIQNYLTHIEGKKATCNSINLFSINYLITLSNGRFYAHNLKFHCKATDHNSYYETTIKDSFNHNSSSGSGSTHTGQESSSLWKAVVLTAGRQAATSENQSPEHFSAV